MENSVENVYNCVYLELLNYLCKSNTSKYPEKAKQNQPHFLTILPNQAKFKIPAEGEFFRVLPSEYLGGRNLVNF